MNATFQTGRKSALLSKRLKKDRFRRGLIITIITLIALPAILYTLKYYVERSYEFTDGEYDSVKISFDAQIAYNKARALIEEGRPMNSRAGSRSSWNDLRRHWSC